MHAVRGSIHWTDATCATPPAYALGTPVSGTPGSFYKLCWAHDPSDISDYKARLVVVASNLM